MASIKLSTTAKPVEPMLEHEIRIRAYDLYERRGAGDGHALDDWLQAEYEVLRQRGGYRSHQAERAGLPMIVSRYSTRQSRRPYYLK